MNKINFLKNRYKAFGYALHGCWAFLKDGTHAKIHLFAAFCMLFWAWYRAYEPWKWAVLLLCIALVLMAESFNSALELLCDCVQPQYDLRIKRIKDIAAGAVLFAALGAVGVLICMEWA